MSKAFLTQRQAFAKLGLGGATSNDFITKAQLIATNRVQVASLSGYSDNQFVVDDDIVKSTPKYLINNDCIFCGACFESGECPVDAIYEGENQYMIDQNKCIQCGNCLDSVCPVDAIIYG